VRGSGEALKSLKDGAESGIIDGEDVKTVKADKGLDVWIDDLTPCLIDRATGEIVDTEYRQVTQAGLKSLQKQGGWQFDWVAQWRNQEPNSEFYKLAVKGSKEVQGVMHIVLERGHVEGKLIETAPHNLGKQGKYKGVGAHLTAIAIKRSQEKGNEGWMCFTAKTALVEHYQRELGAEILFDTGSGVRMQIDPITAQRLVEKYIKKQK
jgi:hypothetical protein